MLDTAKLQHLLFLFFIIFTYNVISSVIVKKIKYILI